MSILEALESIIGETLTPVTGERIAASPADQVRHFLQQLAPHYGVPVTRLIDDYFDPAGTGTPFHFSIDPEPLESEYVDAAEIQRFDVVSGEFKSALLYLEHVALPDPFDYLFARPLADLIGETDEVNAFYGESDTLLERAWSVAVQFLVVVAPLVRAGIVDFVPYRWLSDFIWVDRASLQDAFGDSFGDDAVLVPHGVFEHVDVGSAITEVDAGGDRHAVADAMAFYDLLSNTRLIPLARTEAGRRALRVVTALENIALDGQVAETATGVLVQNRLPGVGRIPIEAVVELRQDDAAFNAWRTSFAEVVLRAQSLPFRSEAQYRADLAEAADDLLKPKIAALDKALRGSNVLRDLFGPNMTQVGVGGLVAVASHSPWGLVAASGSALVKFGANVINKRLGRTARHSATLRDLYAYLITDAS